MAQAQAQLGVTAMASTSARQQDYITSVRAANKAVWDGILKLKALQREWNSNDYGNTLGDGIGSNDEISGAEIGAVVFDAADALEAVLATGVGGNMAAIL